MTKKMVLHDCRQRISTTRIYALLYNPVSAQTQKSLQLLDHVKLGNQDELEPLKEIWDMGTLGVQVTLSKGLQRNLGDRRSCILRQVG